MYFIIKFITTLKSTHVQLMSYIKEIYIKLFVHIKSTFHTIYICERVTHLNQKISNHSTAELHPLRSADVN